MGHVYQFKNDTGWYFDDRSNYFGIMWILLLALVTSLHDLKLKYNCHNLKCPPLHFVQIKMEEELILTVEIGCFAENL